MFCVSGIAGCCAKTTVAPFDRVKILLQAHHKHYSHLGKNSELFLPNYEFRYR
jgi:solute carrier family 25 protein 16